MQLLRIGRHGGVAERAENDRGVRKDVGAGEGAARAGGTVKAIVGVGARWAHGLKLRDRDLAED